MNTRVVQPSRPIEIDIVIELPSLAPVPDMQLDVSDDSLSFKAKRVTSEVCFRFSLLTLVSCLLYALTEQGDGSYSLKLKLPYPCDGAKGKAK